MPPRNVTSRIDIPEVSKEEGTLFEIGVSGLSGRTSGKITEDSANELIGIAGVRKFQEMAENSAIAGAGLRIYKLLLEQVSYTVVPRDDSQLAARIAEFVEGALDDMSQSKDQVLEESRTMLDYGWAWHEIVFKLRRGMKPGAIVDDAGNEIRLPRSKFSDGLIGWRKMPLRGQDTLSRWEIDPAGGIQAMWQNTQEYGEVRIPIERASLFRTSIVKNNPEGKSLLRQAWINWRYLKRFMEVEAIGVYRDLNGIPVGTAPADVMAANATGAKKDQRKAFEALVAGLHAGDEASFVKPAGTDANGNPHWNLELLKNEGTKNFDTNAIITRYELRIATSMLTAFLMLGQSRTGARAVSEDHSDLLLMALNALAVRTASVFESFTFPRLVQLNGFPVELSPKYEAAKVKRAPKAKEVADMLKTLSDTGFPVDTIPILEQVLTDADLPTKGIDDPKAEEL